MLFSIRRAIMASILFFLFAAPANQSALSDQKTWTIGELQSEATSLAISPYNPNIAYASLIRDGAIFKTTDAGGSWTRVLKGAEVSVLGAHPSNPDRVIATAYIPASRSWAVMNTSDGGKTWVPIDYPPFSEPRIYISVQFHPADPNIIDIVEETHVYRSSDGGKEWNDTSSPAEVYWGWIDAGIFRQLVVDPENPDIFFSVVWDALYKSTDGGSSWFQLPSFPGYYARTFVSSVAFNPRDPKVLWAGTGEGILKSVDGGTEWKLVNRDVRGVSRFVVDPIITDNIYAAVYDRVTRSTDGGTTWSDMNEGLTPPGYIYSLVINPQNPQLLYAATQSGVYSYSMGSHVATLYFPRLVTKNVAATDPEDTQYTGISIVNVDSENAGLTFTAYSLDGTLITGNRITNPAMRFVRAGAQIAVMDCELWGEEWAAIQRVGWFTVDSTAKIAGYLMTFNQGLSTISGIDAGSESARSLLFTEVAATGFTRIHLANPNVIPATASFELVDQNGQVKRIASRKIEPDGALVELMSSLFPGVECEQSDYLRVNSDQTVISLEATDKLEQFTHALNGQDSLAGTTTLYCPQYIAGGSDWNTTISIVNPSVAEATAVLRLIGDDGVQIGQARSVTIPRRGKAFVGDQALFISSASVQVQGYLHIESIGPSAPPLIGSVSLGDPGKGNLGVSLPLVQNLATDFVFSQVASDGTWWSGIIIVNPNDSTATVTLELFDRGGSALSTKTLMIPPGQRISRLLADSEYFGEFAGKEINSGYVHVVSDKGLAAFAALGTRSLSGIATVPAQSIR